MVRMNRNVILLGIVSFLNDASSEMIAPVLPIFLTNVLSAGKIASGSVMGLIESFSSLFKVLFGYVSDRMERRKLFVFIGYSISGISKALLAFVTSAYDFLAVRTLDRVGKGIRTSPRDAIISESVSKSESGRSFGFHRMLDTFGAVIGPVFAILFLTYIGMERIRLLFLLSIIPCLIALFILTFVRERGKGRMEKKKPRIATAFAKRELRFFLLCVLISSLGRYSYAFTIWRAEELGFGIVQDVAFYMLFNIVYGLSAYPVGIYSDKVGKGITTVIGFALFSVSSILFAVSDNLPLLLLAFAIFGIATAIEDTVPRAYMSDLAGEFEKGTVIGAYHTIYGICVFPASLIVSLLWQNFSLSHGFMYAAFMNGVAAVILAILLSRKR